MSELRESTPATVTTDFITTPGGSTVAVITLSSEADGRPAVLGPIGLSRVDNALDDLTPRIGDDVVAVIVRGVGKTFCAGADLDMMAGITDIAVSTELAEQGHSVLGRLGLLGVPTIAEINGVALGGGLELALHCTHRYAAASVKAVGLPEISLGLIPGWGGATLLPRLIGFTPALDVLIHNPVKNNRLLSAIEAHALGIVDDVVPDDALHDEVLAAIDSGLHQRAYRQPATDEELDGLRETVTKLSQRPANPRLALTHLARVLEHGHTVEDGFRAEKSALAALIVTPEFRNRVYSFHLTTSRARKPAGVPSDPPIAITHVGVIGAGLMACQFAALFAERLGVRVTMTDVSEDRLDAARARIASALEQRVERGTLTGDRRTAILDSIHLTLDKTEFATCDFVMEAVFEEESVKVNVFRDIEDVVSAGCILATNTSSLSVGRIASRLAHPKRLIGFHFFNPVAVMPLIEVVASAYSLPVAISTAVSCATSLRKTPVITKDAPGFVVNRILSVFLSEVLALLDDGASVDEARASAEPLRLPMDPFALIDLIGRTVTLHMLESLHEFAPQRVTVSDRLRRAEADGGTNPIAEAFRDYPPSNTTNLTTDDMTARIADALTREIDLMLRERIVADIKDIDLCMITGAGWPAAHGGISRYLDETGSSERVLGRRFH